MAYNPTVPMANQKIEASQQPIADNFAALAPFGNGYGSFTNQSTPPTFATGVDGVYTQNNATTGINELYIHKQSAAGVKEIPMTASILSLSTPTANSSGWTYLPSGILILWGSVTSATGLSTITLSGGYPSFGAILNISLTPFSSSTSDANFAVRLVSIDSTTQFKVFLSSRTSTGSGTGGFQYMAIGR